jgi:hypothetical protein
MATMATGKKQQLVHCKQVLGFALLHDKEAQACHYDLIVSLGHAPSFCI